MPFRRPQGTRNPPQARAASRPSGGPVNRGGAAVVGLVFYKYKPTSYGVENNYLPAEVSAALRTTQTGFVAMATAVVRLPIRPPCGD
jgi:hypothetical protein